MSKFLISIYEWFEQHKGIFYLVLIGSIMLFAVMASQISFQENITNFFNSSKNSKNSAFQTVAAKDKIIVMLSGDNPDNIITSAEIFENELDPLVDEGLISAITAHADEETVTHCISFIYKYLPIFLTDEDYAQLKHKISDAEINNSVRNVYNILTSPSGMVIGDVVMRDPLNIGTHLLKKFEQFNPNLQYEIYNGRLFTKDLSTMLMFIQPSNGMGDTGNNDRLVSCLENAERAAEIDSVEIDCIGGPIVAVYNARQIKKDTTITLSLALVFILIVIFLSFRNRLSIPFIIVPPIYGVLFALAMVWLVQGRNIGNRNRCWDSCIRYCPQLLDTCSCPSESQLFSQGDYKRIGDTVDNRLFYHYWGFCRTDVYLFCIVAGYGSLFCFYSHRDNGLLAYLFTSIFQRV